MASSLSLLKSNPKVEFTDDESAIGNGYIVTLKRGWTWRPGEDDRVRAFPSRTNALLALRAESWPHEGPYHP